MAVVEKKPETVSAAPMKLGVAGLVGVVYLLGALAVSFKAVPAVLRMIGLTTGTMGGAVVVGILCLAALVGLLIVGRNLAGGNDAQPGLRAAVFVGFVFLLVWALLSRWIGGLVEGWTYDNNWFEGKETLISGGLAAVLAALFGWLLLRIYLGVGFGGRFVALGEAGWFTPLSYKPGQGNRVRRATTLAILFLTGSGIWVLLNRGMLERGSPDWNLDVPFTGTNAIEDAGDSSARLDEKVGADLTLRQQMLNEGRLSLDKVVILSVGDADRLEKSETYSRQTVLDAAETIADAKRKNLAKLLSKLEKRSEAIEKEAGSLSKGSPKRLGLEEEGDRLRSWVQALQGFEKVLKSKDPERLLLVQRDIETWVQSAQDRERERLKADEAADKRGSLKPEMNAIAEWSSEDPLPVAAVVMNRFAARDLNALLDPNRYRIVVDEEYFQTLDQQKEAYRANAFLTADQFDRAVKALQDKTKPRRADFGKDEEYDGAVAMWERDQAVKIKEAAARAARETKPMKGPATTYASLTLLPTVKFTVPLVLLCLSVWFAWRVVNVPSFADFLIATESELNKVSWTTRSRVIQDTIVVLVTMIAMAVFLFMVDAGWRKVLQSPLINVLKLQPKETAKEQKNLKW